LTDELDILGYVGLALISVLFIILISLIIFKKFFKRKRDLVQPIYNFGDGDKKT